MEPPVCPISPPETVINIVGIPCFDRVPPGSDCLRQVVGMDGIPDLPTLQFFESFAEIFKDLVVDEFDLAICSHDGHQAGNAIDDQAKSQFALAQGIVVAPAKFGSARFTCPPFSPEPLLL